MTTAPDRQPVEPLDPDSDRGQELRAELTELLASFRLAIAERRQKSRGSNEAA
jgi:hypothetical protein